MKRVFCCLLAFSVVVSSLIATASANDSVNDEDIYQDAINMDQSKDSDADGVMDAVEIIYGLDAYSSDTDSDGVDDYTELYITHTDFDKIDGDLDSDGDSLTNAEEGLLNTNAGDDDTDGDRLDDGDELLVYGTNPLAADTDGDGLYDDVELFLGLCPTNAYTDGVTNDAESDAAARYLSNETSSGANLSASKNSGYSSRAVDFPPSMEDLDPGGGMTINATLNVIMDESVHPSNVSYKLDFSEFFGSNTAYSRDLAIVSALLSANAYSTNRIHVEGAGFNSSYDESMSDWMRYHIMQDYHRYDLNSSYNDQHVSEVYIARKEVTKNGYTKNIICVSIRGTNGTLDEWQSNFDIGDTTESPRHTQWTNTNNHKGFDITANRINTILSNYLSTYCAGKNNVLWIMGHSRGGALANVLAAKRIDAGNTVFAYTFASPNTTTLSTANSASKYQCIFNIINEDDYVTKLPMTGWNFRRYGVDKAGSVNENYKAEWNDLTFYSGTYNCDTIGMNRVLNALTAIASNRNACYLEVAGASGYIYASFLTATARNNARNTIINSYTSNMAGTYRVANTDSSLSYYYYIYQKPIFFMQTLAAIMSGHMTAGEFLALDLAPYLLSARLEIGTAYLGGMQHPHYVESYYLLATKLS